METRPRTGLAALAAVLLVADASPAFGPRMGRLFQRLDANGDGAIERSEVEVVRERLFARFDADGDGFLTREEIESASSRRRRRAPMGDPAARAERLDADGDGAVSEAEFVRGEAPVFERADADGDGRLTRTEAEVFVRELREARQG